MRGPQPEEKLPAEVVIIGGGVIGLSIARELARRGVRNVVVIERGDFGREASWAAGGILAPQIEADHSDDFFALAKASRDMYSQFAASLREETGIDVELDQTGTLYLAFSEPEARELQRRYEWQRREGLRIELLAGDEAREIEPNLSACVRSALLFPDDWHVNNRKLVEALIAANERLGVSLRKNCEAIAILTDAGTAIGVKTAQGIFDAPKIVIAAGSWSSQISKSRGAMASLAIEPVRGQMLCFKCEPQLVRHVIYSARGYLVPRRDGKLLAGSTSEQVGFDKHVTEEGRASIEAMAREIVPSLAKAQLFDSWAGLRPRAADGLPVIGPSEEIDGLFYATGHYRNGILLAPITASALSGTVLNGEIEEPMESFLPSRFRMAATAS